MPAFRFSTDEYRARVRKLQAGMAERGFDAVLLMAGSNIVYFCGYPAPQLSSARPFFLVVPAAGSPAFLVHAGRQFEARSYTRQGEIHLYHTLTGLPEELPALLADCVGTGAVGCEIGRETYLNLPLDQFTLLRERLPQTDFRDAADLVWDLRMVKSEAEISCHREACRVTGDAYEATFRAVGAGASQQEVARRMRVESIENGGSDPFVLINSGPDTYDFATGVPGERTLAPGDMLWMDAGCTVTGYWSDFSRAAVVGEPSPEQARMHADIAGLTQACVDMVRPGLTCADLARYCNAELTKLKAPATSVISGLAGRVGHGVGLTTTEPPHIAEYDERPLAPGMVITIEPGVATAYGTFHVEANVAVTNDGCEVLSTFSPDLHVL